MKLTFLRPLFEVLDFLSKDGYGMIVSEATTTGEVSRLGKAKIVTAVNSTLCSGSSPTQVEIGIIRQGLSDFDHDRAALPRCPIGS